MEQEKRRGMMTPEIEARSVELLDVAIVNRWSPHALEEKRKMVEITDEQLNADQALCDAATEGPWTQGLGDIFGAIATGVPWSEIDAGDVKIYCKNDGTDEGFIPVADFIVAAREPNNPTTATQRKGLTFLVRFPNRS